eukprot:Tbor_TRINITY_DN6080_c0_g1::TRINITY_DN6080_c0_g1_i3::g.11268::m.11268/K00760/hprT, hpt, HPRT1; hypoxanthine phosphoribosyltransferase
MEYSSTDLTNAKYSGPIVDFPENVESILADRHMIREKITQLAHKLVDDYRNSNLSHETGNPLIVVAILKGAVFFAVDLSRELSRLGLPIVLDFMICSSYSGATKTSGEVKVLQDIRESIKGKHVLVVEDMVDSAYTLSMVETLFSSRSPASMKVVAMCDKPGGRQIEYSPTYSMFILPKRWVMGYGLDGSFERFRYLPDICIRNLDVPVTSSQEEKDKADAEKAAKKAKA